MNPSSSIRMWRRGLWTIWWAWPLCAQPPAIHQEGVFNAASRMPPSLPGGALAPGARVIVQGLRFEAGSKAVLRAGGRSFELGVRSLAPGRIEARIPVSVPTGPAEVVVSNQDGASRGFAVRMAAAGFGIFSANDKSWGPAKLEEPPGRRVRITGTGLAQVRDPRVLVGGKLARVLRAGPRLADAGTDEIEFEIPAGVPEGCHVPVTVVLPGGAVSNTVSVPVGRCEEAAAFPLARARGQDSAALLLLARLILRVEPQDLRALDFTQDIGAAAFGAAPAIRALLNPWRLRPPPGTCTAYTGKFYGDVGEATLPDFFASVMGDRGLPVAGPVEVRGPRGTRALPAKEGVAGFYQGTLGIDKPVYGPAIPLFLEPGTHRFTWPGGPAVNASVAPPFSWRQPPRAIDRRAGFTVRWRDAPGGTAMGILAVNVDPETTAMGVCFCLAPPGAREFRVPAVMLANLPASRPSFGIPMSFAMLAPLPPLESFPAPGLDYGAVLTTTVRGVTVTYR